MACVCGGVSQIYGNHATCHLWKSHVTCCVFMVCHGMCVWSSHLDSWGVMSRVLYGRVMWHIVYGGVMAHVTPTHDTHVSHNITCDVSHTIIRHNIMLWLSQHNIMLWLCRLSCDSLESYELWLTRVTTWCCVVCCCDSHHTSWCDSVVSQHHVVMRPVMWVTWICCDTSRVWCEWIYCDTSRVWCESQQHTTHHHVETLEASYDM